MSPRRALITQPSVHGELLERVVAGVEDLKLGDPLDPETQMGPLVSREQLDRVSGFVAEGRDTANIRSGGERVAPAGLEGGLFFAPTVVEGLRAASRLIRDEIFGACPLGDPGVLRGGRRATGERHELRPRGLPVDQRRLASPPRRASIEAGSVSANTFDAPSGYGVRFGGWKQSRDGVEGGLDGARA